MSKYTPTTVSPLQLYLKEISKYPLLEPEEEFELAQKHYDEGDRESAHRLITANLRLVVKIANDFRRAQIEVLDLIQEGTHGLMQAVKKYNPYKGVKLSSYAAWWIRAYILKYLMEHKSQVKIATTATQRKLYYNLQKETERLLQSYDKVSPALIAESLNVPEKDVVEMQLRLNSADYSLDAPSGDSQEHRRDQLKDERIPELDEILASRQIQSIFSQHLQEFTSTLDERDRFILENRLRNEVPMSLREIGEKYKISRERVRQIETRIIKRLKAFVEDKGVLPKPN